MNMEHLQSVGHRFPNLCNAFMKRRLTYLLVAVALLGGVASANAQTPRASLGEPVVFPPESKPADKLPLTAPPPRPGEKAMSLADLIQISLGQNPALAQAGLEIEVARGNAVQSGLYPNPMVTVS